MPRGLGAWWSWWFATRHWYGVYVSSPTTGGAWHNPRQLTESQAAAWRADVQEANWNAEVVLVKWNGYDWEPAYS
jgi:hypothetical protein